ncbi:MAG: glycine cleavage system aminomethyltransferase GcvT [Armatimonadota bacterium]
MKTPIYEYHISQHAKMTEFAGWDMPLYYTGIIHEVNVVRTSVGAFDLSHMGEIYITGRQALDLLQYVTTNDVSRLLDGDALYTLICDDNGGILDDLVIYKLDKYSYMLVVNAINAEQDVKWLKDHNKYDAVINDQTANTGLIAIQGPSSIDFIKSITKSVIPIYAFKVTDGKIADIDCRIASTGYTGEDGFEIYCSADDCMRLWQFILESGKSYGLEPAGLGARDVLRIEAGYPLYGNDLSRSTTPVDAHLMWTVKLSKENFIGKDAILKAEEKRPQKVLIGIESSERCVPRNNYEIFDDGDSVGHVTSGTFSPTLKKGIALVYLDVNYSQPGRTLCLHIRERSCNCHVVNPPFYKPDRVMKSMSKREVKVES